MMKFFLFTIASRLAGAHLVFHPLGTSGSYPGGKAVGDRN